MDKPQPLAGYSGKALLHQAPCGSLRPRAEVVGHRPLMNGGASGRPLPQLPTAWTCRIRGFTLALRAASEQLCEVAPDVFAAQGTDEGVDEGVGLPRQLSGILARAWPGCRRPARCCPPRRAPGEADAEEDDEHGPQSLEVVLVGTELRVLPAGDAAHQDAQAPGQLWETVPRRAVSEDRSAGGHSPPSEPAPSPPSMAPAAEAPAYLGCRQPSI